MRTLTVTTGSSVSTRTLAVSLLALVWTGISASALEVPITVEEAVPAQLNGRGCKLVMPKRARKGEPLTVWVFRCATATT